ncbi:MAG: hemerythrin family protein [Alphaproteobacteria bacterium]|nr:hemerythrin family protein [Alphaproteobacteria bacterium]
MSEHISWSDELLVGVDAIDADHKALIGLMNAIFATATHGPAAINSAIGELTAYTKRHFTAEQEIMEQAGYDGLKAHVYEHEHLIFRLETMIERLMMIGVEGIDAELVALLRAWLVDHIMGFDKTFAAFLHQRA